MKITKTIKAIFIIILCYFMVECFAKTAEEICPYGEAYCRSRDVQDLVYRLGEIGACLQIDYDSLGNLIRECYQSSIDDSLHVDLYYYDEKGNLEKEVLRSGSVRLHDYDSNGFNIQSKKIRKIDNGDYASETGIEVTTYQFDSKGNLIYKSYNSSYSENPKAWDWNYQYDANGNLICIEQRFSVRAPKYIRGTETTWYEYDSQNRLIHYRSDRSQFDSVYDGYLKWTGSKKVGREKVCFVSGEQTPKKGRSK